MPATQQLLFHSLSDAGLTARAYLWDATKNGDCGETIYATGRYIDRKIAEGEPHMAVYALRDLVQMLLRRNPDTDTAKWSVLEEGLVQFSEAGA